MPHAKLVAELEFDYSDEYDYCEILQDIIDRGREYASFEIVGEVIRTREDGSVVGCLPTCEWCLSGHHSVQIVR